MSKNSETPSVTADDRQSAHSVFDFLYNDSRRVGSYLSQFEVGHLTQLAQSNESGSSTSERSGRNFSLGVTSVLGGTSNSSETEGETAKEGLVRTYDPYWTNARAFLDYLNERDLVERNIHFARMGQFVLVRGKMAVLDFSSMQSVWQLPLFKKMVADGMAEDEEPNPKTRNSRRVEGKNFTSDPYAKMETPFRLAMEMLPAFPHLTVAAIVGANWSTWSTLTPEHLVGSATDLTLKHGNKVAGDWAMLGVLDALPDDANAAVDEVDQFFVDLPATNIIAHATLGLGPVIRMLSGRPGETFGVTPLLIFREIAR